MANEEMKQGQLQIELSPEVVGGVYANMAMIAHSRTEFVVDFVSVMPGAPKAKVQSRVVLAPEHAKRLLYALQENISRYEQAFGPIKFPEVPQAKNRTIAPFGTPQGEA